MDEIEKKIIKILESKANGLMANELAALLNIQKKELNPILYGKLKDKYLYVYSDYVWHSMKIKAIRETVSKKEDLPKNWQKRWTQKEKDKLMEEYIFWNSNDKHSRLS